jgi:hypothetical protein
VKFEETKESTDSESVGEPVSLISGSLTQMNVNPLVTKIQRRSLKTTSYRKKRKYLAACHERRRDFTPLIYSVDGMASQETKEAEKQLARKLAMLGNGTGNTLRWWGMSGGVWL